jgi:hypothetical protein
MREARRSAILLVWPRRATKQTPALEGNPEGTDDLGRIAALRLAYLEQPNGAAPRLALQPNSFVRTHVSL